MFDMMGMMGKVKEMQQKMQEAQSKLSEITAEGESGGGMVKVLVNGKKEILKIEIEPQLVQPDEVSALQDLLVAALNHAMTKIDEKAKEELSGISDILPNIPGLDKLFNR